MCGVLLMIEEALEVATQWVVFEPNERLPAPRCGWPSPVLLDALAAGCLAGNSTRGGVLRAVRRGQQPALERDQGRLRVQVGVAPSVPYEFIVLRLGRITDELELVER